MDEISNIIQDTRKEHDKKYGPDIKNNIDIVCKVEYLDKLTNKIKVFKINGGKSRIEKRVVASNYRFAVNEVIELVIIIKKEKSRYNIRMLPKINMPMGTKLFFFKIANNKEYVTNYCTHVNTPINKICLWWYEYNNPTSGKVGRYTNVYYFMWKLW